MVAYPFIIIWMLSQGQILWGSALLAVVAIGRYVLHRNMLFMPVVVLAMLCAGLTLLLRDGVWLKFYPVAMSLAMLSIFLFTLFYPPSMIERFARIHQPDLPESGIKWTRKVTQVWCVFFVCNALVSMGTIFWGTDKQWMLYNGFISYILMGILLAGEWILRKYYQAKYHH